MMTTTTVTSVQPNMKRKQSAAGLATGGRNVKRRASKACHCCRSRKVRCDVVESGIPCTNCRLDEVECLVTEGKRRRKSYVDDDLLHHHSSSVSVEGDKELPIFPIFDDIAGLNDVSLTLGGMGGDPTMASLEEGLHHHRPHMLCVTSSTLLRSSISLTSLSDQTQGHRMSPQERSRRMSAMGPNTKLASLPSPAFATPLPGYFPPQNKHPEIILPRYVRPVPQSIMSEDLAYLHQRGAFMVPDTSLRNELLRCYAQYVHPFLPLLDLQDFLASVEKNDPKDTLSLLLFQAVMFAGTGFIDMRYLLAQGYDSRKAARRAFFQRAKLLYDFDYETDRVTVVQTVLLMTYWYEAPDDPKCIWHWLGIAVSLARTIGINCDTSESGMDLKTRKLWKRIWWCCFLRDRLIALGMRRPLRIPEKEFDLPMLELEDFETAAMPQELSRMLGGCPAVKDSDKRITLAKMCIALAKLCACVTTVLDVQYSLMAAKLGLTKETTVRLVPKKTAADPSDVIRCDRQLEDWHSGQAAETHFFAPGTQERTNTNDGEVISLHRSVITGVYLTAMSALHRPQMMPTMPSVVVAPELQELSRRKVREAANDITEMYKDLYACDMIRYLPNTGVSCILPALILHMVDLKSSDASIRQAASRKFQFCMQSLQRLREMYASADFAFSFLDTAVRRTETQIPSAPMASQPNHEMDFKQEVASHYSTPMLTPPPEAAWTANRMLFASTLAPEERKLLAAFTPPKSDHSLHSVMTGGAAIALTDLPISEHDDSEAAESSEEMEARQLEQQAMNDFDALINLEGGGEQLQTDKGIYAEMNMAWLNGMNDDHDYEHDEDDEMFHKSVEDSTGGYQEVSKTGDLDTDLSVWDHE
jgi:Fungal specific transcription factor domain/Fungal Zn(2)-Cys(6) binuclear cluster domain